MNLTDTARSILHTLLDRYEQPGRRNAVRVRMNQRDHPAYFSIEESDSRHATNDQLGRLSAEGLLGLHWRTWEEGNWLEAVDLIPEQATAIYALLGRSPRDTQEQALRRLLDAQNPQPGWHAGFLAWARTQLDSHHGIGPLDRNDLQLNVDLLAVLAAIAALPAPILERTLSVRLFGDSKRIEGLRGGLLRVLRRHDPHAFDFGDDDWALLQAHNLDRAPEYVPIAGPLALRMSGEPPAPAIDLALFQPSVALSAAMLRNSEVVGCAAEALVTVENATSFNALLAARPAEVLVVYTGGFASPTVIRLLRAVQIARPDLRLLHWGDLDAGGLRILAHLRQHVGPIAPLAMRPALLDTYSAFARSLTDADRPALLALRDNPTLADCAALIDRLLNTGHKLEQEAVDIAEVLKELGERI